MRKYLSSVPSQLAKRFSGERNSMSTTEYKFVILQEAATHVSQIRSSLFTLCLPIFKSLRAMFM